MATAALCAICHKRKPKRECPGVHGAICPQCCGTEREVTVDCPLDCSYLRESRKHDAERMTAPPELYKEMPYKEVEVPDRFLYDHEQFIGQISIQMLRHYLANPSVTDQELQAALDKLIQTYQTRQSGIYYDSVPESGAAAGVFRDVKTFFDEIEKKSQQDASASVKDGDVIRALVFLYRLAVVHNNHRPRGRAFLSFLRQTFPEVAAAKEESRLIIPGR